ncbi:hypothetical protein [Nocardia sp. NPDC057030]|uniref:hypothetical protein n=1 Tax=unclassified Nocardia TaxID=2637762 RepID=UPI00363A7C14
MSRTDKTAPFRVKLRRGDLSTREHHDHRNGVCELATDARRVEFAPGACYLEFHFTGTQVCCCPMCHAYEPPLTETQRRRRDRRRAKQHWGHRWPVMAEVSHQSPR